MKAAFVVVAAAVLASVAGAVLYLAGIKHLHWTVIRPLLSPDFVRSYLADPRLRRLIDVMNDEATDRSDAFVVFWGADKTELISKRLFRQVNMYGARRYMYRPDVRTLQFVTGAAGVYRAMEMEDSPALREALAGLDTRRLVEASYDRLGFRHVDAELTRDCATRVLFLGDSFTDGVGVNDAETFVNVYGHLVRDRLHVAVCPINAGVEGYGSLEEAYVLDTYFQAFGRPPVIVVMHYANDVDDDEEAVIRGAFPETDLRWSTSLNYLTRIVAAAREQGATLLIAAAPPSQQFLSPSTRSNYQDVLRRFCEQHGVRFIDLFPPISRSGPKSAYFEDDPHWTPEGHRVVAEALFESTRDVIAR